VVQRSPEYQWITADGPAFGAPGLAPRWTSSEKDAVCTAYSASSRVWFTVSHGIVNEIYYPTIDRPQVRDFGFLISDGETFFHEEKRDLNHTIEYLDTNALGIRIIGEDPKGRYTLTKEIIADPHQSAVLIHVRINADADLLSRMGVYALLAPHLEVCGYHNSGRVLDVCGRRCLVAWRDITSLVMAADCGFSKASCGYVGASDGWTDLSQNFQMDWQFDEALDGNIALTGAIDVARHPEFTVAIGFGRGHHAALATVAQTLGTDFAHHRERYIEQWHRARCTRRPGSSTDKGRLLSISHSVLLAHEDKTFQGAFIASASIPWGQSKGDDDLGGYHLVWTRDMVQSATALLALGRKETALRALIYLACSQRPDGGFSQNFWVNGTPYWNGMQLDEVAFPIVLAWRLWKEDAIEHFHLPVFIERAAAFLIRNSPVTQQERWEENAGYSPSTLAAVIAGLICASELMRVYGAPELSDFYAEFADWIEANLEKWTVTEEGILLPEVKRHFMRIRPPRPVDPFYDPELGPGNIRISNRAPGEKTVFQDRQVIDAGFLELVRYGIRQPHDPLIVDSLRVVDAVLKVSTPEGPCWRRYNHDGYGQAHDGGPYTGWGQGRAWPLLTGERAHYELAAGNDVKPYITAMERFASAGGMLPEQIWDAPDLPERGMFLGRPSGSAMPLAWAHSEYIKLLRSAEDGEVFDRIEPVARRYRNRPAYKGPEFCKRDRLPDSVVPGGSLRIVEGRPFRIVWSDDGWKTNATVHSTPVGAALHYADIAVGADAVGVVSFTFFWIRENAWEGKNYDVPIRK
jgi:glucoamylase